MLYLIEEPRVPWHAGSHELPCRSRCSQEFADWAVGSWVLRFAGLIWLADSNEALRLRLDKKLRVGSMDQCIILGHLCQVFRCSGVQVMTPRMIEKFRVYYLGANLSMREANNLPTTSTCKHQWDHCNLTAGQTPQNVGDTTLGRTLDSPFAVLLESLVEVSPKAKQTFQKFPNMCLLS